MAESEKVEEEWRGEERGSVVWREGRKERKWIERNNG